MSKFFLVAFVYLFSSVAIAGPDCAPNLRAKGLYQCESQSREASGASPKKVCEWNKADKTCKCCIHNDEAAGAQDEQKQEGFDRSHLEDEKNPEPLE